MWALDFVEIIGLIAATLTTASFVPQVWRSWKTKDVTGLSLTMYLVFFTGVSLWTVYGIYMNSIAIVLANSITGLLVVFLLVLKIKHHKKE